MAQVSCQIEGVDLDLTGVVLSEVWNLEILAPPCGSIVWTGIEQDVAPGTKTVGVTKHLVEILARDVLTSTPLFAQALPLGVNEERRFMWMNQHDVWLEVKV